jgi:hypothetical protein
VSAVIHVSGMLARRPIIMSFVHAVRVDRLLQMMRRDITDVPGLVGTCLMMVLVHRMIMVIVRRLDVMLLFHLGLPFQTNNVTWGNFRGDPRSPDQITA